MGCGCNKKKDKATNTELINRAKKTAEQKKPLPIIAPKKKPIVKK